MGNFSQGGSKGGFGRDNRNAGRDGGRPGGFQKREWGGRDSGNKEQMMHQATCSECGKRCEVPFRPVNGKPVFCNDCFSAKRGASTGGDRNDRVPAKAHYENRDNRGSDEGVKRQLSEMNMKLDRLVKAVEALSGTNPKPAVADAPKKEEKKSVDVVELKKVLDKATGKETVKKTAVKKAPKKAVAVKKKK